MEGQNGGYRPRTAGQRAQMPGDSDNGVRDWQRNTWYGPAPVNSNPFDEPEDAPELKASRSENVNEHIGDFWNAPGQMPGYRNTSSFQRQNTGKSIDTCTPAKVKTGGQARTLRIIAVIAVLIVAVLLVLRYVIFSVKEIRVIGNNLVSAEEIIRTSGVHLGDGIFLLNEKNVEQNITSDYRLRFGYMAREFPDKITISVREREPSCWLTYCGIMYVMDKYRMVLYESEDPNNRPADLVEVKGLEIRSNTMVGQFITLGNEAQQSIFTELFLEMKVLGCTDKIAEADISNTESILLATREGYTVSMGDRTNLHAKLRSLLWVQEELVRLGKDGGTINVSNPEAPVYSK